MYSTSQDTNIARVCKLSTRVNIPKEERTLIHLFIRYKCEKKALEGVPDDSDAGQTRWLLEIFFENLYRFRKRHELHWAVLFY